jgi:hypothetical protein
MQMKTTHSEQVWTSPDGARKIWEVSLADDSGKEYKLKTYSPKIGQLGFKGDVKSYLTARGDRFVRQEVAATGARTSSGYQPRDDNAIRAQWAIGQAINLAAVKMDKDAITLPVIESYAKELFTTVSRVKGEELSSQQEAEADQYIRGFTQTAGAF